MKPHDTQQNKRAKIDGTVENAPKSAVERVKKDNIIMQKSQNDDDRITRQAMIIFDSKRCGN